MGSVEIYLTSGAYLTSDLYPTETILFAHIEASQFCQLPEFVGYVRMAI